MMTGFSRSIFSEQCSLAPSTIVGSDGMDKRLSGMIVCAGMRERERDGAARNGSIAFSSRARGCCLVSRLQGEDFYLRRLRLILATFHTMSEIHGRWSSFRRK